jgi:energy-coupling factor transport system ATP-binding protein
VVMAEHRLERVIQYADRVIEVPGGTSPVTTGLPADLMRTAPVAPPVVHLGRLAGWTPLPLSIRDARRAAAPLRTTLSDHSAVVARRVAGRSAEVAPDLVVCGDLVAGYGEQLALRGVSLRIGPGEVVAVMGRNGAGKSTLLNAMVGLVPARGGSVRVSGTDPRRARPKDLVGVVGLVPQEPADLLYAASVAAECAQADRDFGAEPGSCRTVLRRLAPEIADDTHPRDLSEGQRLCLALAVVLSGRPPLVLLDEPTRGLDYGAKTRLVAILRDLAAAGHAVLLSTHDVELVAEVATRVMVLADGELVGDGETATVIAGSPAFAPQVAKILAPLPFLTVGEVAEALEAAS